MAALTAVLDLRASPFASKLAGAVTLSGTAAKQIQAQWAAHAVFLEQQIAAATRAGQSTKEWATELQETNLALKELAAANQIATAGIKKTGNALANANWRTIGREIIVIFREIGRGNWSRVPGSLSIILQSLGSLTSLFSPLTIGLGLVAGAAGLVAMQMRKVNLEAQEEYSILGRLKNLWEYQARAMQTASDRAREFSHWLEHLHDHQESASESAEQGLRALRDEFELRQRMARASGQTPAQARAAEADQAKREADYIREKMYDTSAFANNAENIAKKREAEAVAGTGLKPGELDAMKQQATELAELIKKRQEAFDKGPGVLDVLRNSIPGQDVIHDFTEEAASIVMLQGKYQDLIKEIGNYEARQKSLDDSAKAARENAERAQEDLNQMKRMAEDKPLEAAKAEDVEDIGGNRQLVRGRLSALQEIGGYIPATNASMIEIHSKSLKHLASIDKKLDTLNQTAKDHHSETKYGNRVGGHAF